MLKSFVVILLSVIMGIAAIHNTYDDRAFERRGKTAVLEPIAKYTEITRKKGGYTTGVSYEADLNFQTESGEQVTVHRKLTEDTINKFAAKEEVLINYLPDDPHNTRFAGEIKGGTGAIGFWSIVLIVGIFWFRRSLKTA